MNKYLVQFTVDKQPVKWVRFGESMQTTLDLVKYAIRKEYPDQNRVGGVCITFLNEYKPERQV